MSDLDGNSVLNPSDGPDRAPGEAQTPGEGAAEGIASYAVGLALAAGLTVVSFLVSDTGLVWRPSIPIALFTLAIAQMGVHLVFFLHITTGADNTNNVLALAFGVLIVFLVFGGSLWIMSHLNANMAPMDHVMQMQR